jgi:hypothetical protein
MKRSESSLKMLNVSINNSKMRKVCTVKLSNHAWQTPNSFKSPSMSRVQSFWGSVSKVGLNFLTDDADKMHLYLFLPKKGGGGWELTPV